MTHSKILVKFVHLSDLTSDVGKYMFLLGSRWCDWFRLIWTDVVALEDRIAAFDNFCLRRILRIPYTAHVINADVRLRAGSPPQLLLLIQTRRLCFFGHVARMSDSQDTFRALHMSTRGLPKDWRREMPPRTSTSHLASDPKCRPPSAQPRTQLSMSTCPGQRTMEATRGNGYAPAWGSLVMMMMMMMMWLLLLSVNST